MISHLETFEDYEYDNAFSKPCIEKGMLALDAILNVWHGVPKGPLDQPSCASTRVDGSLVCDQCHAGRFLCHRLLCARRLFVCKFQLIVVQSLP